MYPDEDYFPPQIHVKTKFFFFVFFLNYFFALIKEQPPLSSILHGGGGSGSGGTVLFSSIENARNTVNFAQSQLARELQMEYAQQPITSLIVC
jgi:hypothetical protein